LENGAIIHGLKFFSLNILLKVLGKEGIKQKIEGWAWWYKPRIPPTKEVKG
jgi:hypothetical protein